MNKQAEITASITVASGHIWFNSEDKLKTDHHPTENSTADRPAQS
jgi:hypothetical protein